MYASFPTRYVNLGNTLRWIARASGILMILIWVTLFIRETFRSHFEFDPSGYPQAAAIAVIFAGYLLGWWKEYAGGVLAIAGTVLFYWIVIVFQGIPMDAGSLFFAVPGVLYLLASDCDATGQADESLRQS
jgi:hypothetical protein